jgi:aconitate hydratase
MALQLPFSLEGGHIMTPGSKNTFGTRSTLTTAKGALDYHSLPALGKAKGKNLSKLPLSLRVLLENLLRHEDGDIVQAKDIDAVVNWDPGATSEYEIQFTPARVLLQDFTGVPVVADLAAMRSALSEKGGEAGRVNPLQPVDLVIDHSVQVDAFGSKEAFQINAKYDYERNGERYEFLKWGQKAFSNFQVVPPATGICHQVNLEFLARVAMKMNGWIYPDTLVGTDSHTPMVNGLGVLGWGVGGIEAEAAMLGQPCSMLIPDVVGVELKGSLNPGVTATDLVLTITQILRKKGVVGKFVEFTGHGVTALSIANRATISNMAPEYGATVGFWPIDAKTIAYLKLTGRTEYAELTEAYYKAQGMWHDPGAEPPKFTDVVTLDLSTVQPSLAGPAKPHDRSDLSQVPQSFGKFLQEQVAARGAAKPETSTSKLKEGSIVLAAITSCTNTSNPTLMLGAALLARKAAARGLKSAPHVKTSFAPGSKAVTAYIERAGLTEDLNKLGFNLVGYGCTTCIGNSGPLPLEIGNEIESRGLTVGAVLSGNRNFEARIHPLIRANYLASPPLVVAFAIAGRLDIDMTKEPLGMDPKGQPVFLKDIWPSESELEELTRINVTSSAFSESYAGVFDGDEKWRSLPISGGESYAWGSDSTYIKRPPFLDPEFTLDPEKPRKIQAARVLGYFGDFITTDHISPAGSIGTSTPAGQYLTSLGVKKDDFNSYGARRGNHEVMMRGTFANVRLRNKLVSKEGGFTRHWPDGAESTIYDAAMKYKAAGVPLVILAGREYGSGSSRDWAAKGTRLLGVRAVIAETYERIHRSNLVGMGVLPLEFTGGESAEKLGLKGDEAITIHGLEGLRAGSRLKVLADRPDGTSVTFEVKARVDTPNELRYFQHGGILPYVLKRLS